VQPLVSWPNGPLTYDGVILTGEESAALTSRGLVERHVVVVPWSVVQLRATELFPRAEKVMLQYQDVSGADDREKGVLIRLARSHVAAGPCLVKEKPGC
jgi:hypothetical protein